MCICAYYFLRYYNIYVIISQYGIANFAEEGYNKTTQVGALFLQILKKFTEKDIMKAERKNRVSGPHYRTGDVWTVKGNLWLVKNEVVKIISVYKHKKECEVEVVNLSNARGWISVKQLKKKLR